MSEDSDQGKLHALLLDQLDYDAPLVGIRLALRENILCVSFPHPYLSAYWQSNHRDAFEAAARACFGQDIQFNYATATTSAAYAPPAAPELAPVDANFLNDFIGSDNNDKVLAAVRQLCAAAAQLRTLIILGEAGTGKSHLLAAIAAKLRQSLGKRAVVLADLQNLPDPGCWAYVKALLMDNIHLATGQTTQSRITALLDGAPPNARIACTCLSQRQPALDCPLGQRLSAWLQVELDPADLPMRIIWLERQNKDRNLGLNPTQILTLGRLGHHIPHLQGLLQKFEFYARIGNRTDAWEELEKLAPPEYAQPWLRILTAVADSLEVSNAELVGTSRRKEIVFARQVAMYLCRTRLGLSYSELGRIFGGRDHATVIHSVRKIETLQQVDTNTHNLLTELTASIF